MNFSVSLTIRKNKFNIAWLPLVLIVFFTVAAISLTAVPRSWAAQTTMEVYQQKDGKVFGLQTSLDIFDNPKLNDQKLLAPSCEGSYVFAVRNSADSEPLPYSLLISAKNPDLIPLVFSLEKNGSYIFGADGISNQLPLGELQLPEVLLGGKSTDFYTLKWSWRTESDALDTAIGKDGTQLYYLTITACGTLDESGGGGSPEHPSGGGNPTLPLNPDDPADPVLPTDPKSPDDSESPDDADTADQSTGPATGDRSHPLLWFALMVASGALLLILLLFKRRKRDDENTKTVPENK